VVFPADLEGISLELFLWRISNHSTLDGRGGLHASARWHSQGHAIVYLASSPAGALVEVLVHLELDPQRLPASYRMLKAESPDEIPPSRIDGAALPDNWRDNLMVTRGLGDEWLIAGQSALLEVPSAILPETFNLLLNPRHGDAARIAVLWHQPFPYDRRFFKVK
jgi:RES domain-containing protein